MFAIVLDADSFLQLVKPREIVGFVQNAVRDSGLRDVQPTVIVLGKHSVRENVVSRGVCPATLYSLRFSSARSYSTASNRSDASSAS